MLKNVFKISVSDMVALSYSIFTASVAFVVFAHTYSYVGLFTSEFAYPTIVDIIPGASLKTSYVPQKQPAAT